MSNADQPDFLSDDPQPLAADDGIRILTDAPIYDGIRIQGDEPYPASSVHPDFLSDSSAPLTGDGIRIQGDEPYPEGHQQDDIQPSESLFEGASVDAYAMVPFNREQPDTYPEGHQQNHFQPYAMVPFNTDPPEIYPEGHQQDDFQPSESLFEGASVDAYAMVPFNTDQPEQDEDKDLNESDGYLGGEEGVFRDDDEDGYLGGALEDEDNEEDLDESVDLKHNEGFERVTTRVTTRRRRFRRSTDPERKRRSRWWCAGFWCCCCIIILLIILIFFKFLSTNEPTSKPTVAHQDDDFVMATPYKGVVTSCFDQYVKGDCYFLNNKFPNPISQCQCFNKITIVANDTLQLYTKIREDINGKIYDGSYDQDWHSCAPSNQALIWLSSCDNRDGGDLYQRYLLALLFIQLNGTKWDQLNNWLESDSECMWFGIQCTGRFKLNDLALDMINAAGSLPTELGKMKGMKAIAMTRNHITGTIPPEIFSMPDLESLLLYANNIRGSIPSEVANAKKLRVLRVDHNLMFGVLQSEIGNVTTLEEFSIGFNEFWRHIPTEIGQLTRMRWLVMQNNRFSGEMPTEFGLMTNLTYFLIQSNLMHGTVPSELQNLNKLEEMRLAHTGLNGVFPTVFGLAWPKVNRLELGFNKFAGTIMTEFGQMTKLSWLALNNNDFTGVVPTEFGNLVNMTRLSFQDTLVTGTIPSQFGHMSMLTNLALDKTTLTGTAPTELCALRNNLLAVFSTDCPTGSVGVKCPVPSCCTFCRRSKYQHTTTSAGNNSNGNTVSATPSSAPLSSAPV
jgi:hypothetical protein